MADQDGNRMGLISAARQHSRDWSLWPGALQKLTPLERLSVHGFQPWHAKSEERT